jgi:hypothetical protein
MRVIGGGILLLVGFLLVGAANWLHFKVEAELLQRRPELGDQFYFFGGVFRKHSLIERLYKSEFPNGKRVRQFWICALSGFVAAALGFVLVGFFK